MTANQASPRQAPAGPSFHLFIYGALRQSTPLAHLLDGCEQVGSATVAGTLYDVDGASPVLVLAGAGKVAGELWRCPVELLSEFDRAIGLEPGRFRRVGVQVAEYGCWTYVAGPVVARQLVTARRSRPAPR